MAALEALEVISPTSSKATTLLRIVDTTKTRAGARYVRRSLVEPSCEQETIIDTQDAVGELACSQGVYEAVLTALRTFPDLERALAALLSREAARLRYFASTEAVRSARGANQESRQDSAVRSQTPSSSVATHPAGRHGTSRTQKALQVQWKTSSMDIVTNVLVIKAALQKVTPILLALENSEAKVFKTIVQNLQDARLSELLEVIDNVIETEAAPHKFPEQMQMEAVFAVKRERNGKSNSPHHGTHDFA